MEKVLVNFTVTGSVVIGVNTQTFVDEEAQLNEAERIVKDAQQGVGLSKLLIDNKSEISNIEVSDAQLI